MIDLILLSEEWEAFVTHDEFDSYNMGVIEFMAKWNERFPDALVKSAINDIKWSDIGMYVSYTIVVK